MDFKNQIDNRIEWIDFAKGIGIVMVVWAHSAGPGSNYIEQFHMPLFFILSGILYKEKEIKEYILGKVISLYIPFAVWNVLFEIIQFFKFNYPHTHGELTLLIIKTLLLLEKNSLFMGATWFLSSLFATEIFFRIVRQLIKGDKLHRVVEIALALCFAIVGFSFNFPYRISRTLILGVFYVIGKNINVYVKRECKVRHDIIGALVMFVLFFFIANNNYAYLGDNQYSSPELFVVGAFLASGGVILSSKVICLLASNNKKYIWPAKEVIVWLGRNSKEVVIWQFVFFRPIIIVQLIIAGENWRKFMNYYPVYDSSNMWWLVYCVAGLFIPILWGMILKKLEIKVMMFAKTMRD